MINVSVIIPAYNSGKTLEATLDSVLAQTCPAWEAIIVDDGSTDNTALLVEKYSAKDPRIKLVRQENQGVSEARNTAIRLATHDWLLFLDSDDFIAPEYLEKMTGVIDSNVDQVVGGWTYVDRDGNNLVANYLNQIDLFDQLTRRCVFAIHACIVKKSIVTEVGGFDGSLKICEDWDLWQKIARTGARVKEVREVLAFYKMQPRSLSTNVEQFLNDMFRVIERGHAHDPRVKNNFNNYNVDRPAYQLATAKFHAITWIAGLLIGEGLDASVIFKKFPTLSSPEVDPKWISNSIFYSAIIPGCQPLSNWHKIWIRSEQNIRTFLSELELRSEPGIAQRCLRILEVLVLDHVKIENSLKIGATVGRILNINGSIEDLRAEPDAQRFVGYAWLDDKKLGTIQLPVCDGLVSKWVIKDAIAAKFSWNILGEFFGRHVYKLKSNEDFDEFHNVHGRTVFLQQILDKQDWPGDRFYDSTYHDKKSSSQVKGDGPVIIDIALELPDIISKSTSVDILFTAGGISIDRISHNTRGKGITAQELRALITTAAGFELCRICVREALIGKSFSDPTSLRNRLADQATGQLSKTELSNPITLLSRDLDTIAGSDTFIIARRKNGIGFSNSRRAILPGSVKKVLQHGAEVTGDQIIQNNSENAEGILYSPEVITMAHEPGTGVDTTVQTKSSIYGRQHFETLFSTQPDPWKYTNPYEQTKYDFTFSLIPDGINSALELACAEGHFTTQLSGKVQKLVAADISEVALERAKERCSDRTNISYKQIDLVKDDISGSFDLIVCSEVLYYVGDIPTLKKVAAKIASAISQEGYLIMAHAHQVIDEPNKPGFDWQLPFGAKVIGDVFSKTDDLQLTREIRTPLYRVQLFQRKKKSILNLFHKSKPEIQMLDQPTPVPPSVQDSVRWNGTKQPLATGASTVSSSKLPILTYHRVAPVGAENMNRYRVDPAQFEQQLKYLSDSGYYSVSWEGWLNAMFTRKPMEGRPIAITFDDGYLDFYEYAWPLLKKYGFTATVFLVTEMVGKTNTWDALYGETVDLMDWKEIQELSAEGIQFGSHTATHKALTSLSAEQLATEGILSRMKLAKMLGSGTEIIAYPYGDTDPVVAHVMGACGYQVGLTCNPGFAGFGDDSMSLPRVEVKGSDTLQEFVSKLQ